MNISKLFINRPIFTSMLFLAISLIGILTFRLLPVEMMPNASFGHITIYIDIRGGIPAPNVEKNVAKPIEDAVGDVTHLKNMLSISKEGNCTVILEFEPGIDMDFAALEVREKLNRIKNELPDEIEKPVIAKYEYTDVPIMIVALMSPIRTPEDLRKIVDEQVKDRIQRIEGVAKVEVAGGRESKIMIEVDKRRLQSFGLPINSIVNTINLNNINLLAGEIKRKNDKYLIRTIGEFKNLEDIENLAISTSKEGSIIRIKDVATVKDSYLDPRGFSRVNARPSVSLYIQKETLANTVKVADAVLTQIEDLRKSLDDDIKIEVTSNQAKEIKSAVEGVKRSLLLGAGLAFVILFLFLREISVITTIAVVVPISVIFTFALMFFSNLSLNLVTLSGLALGVGMLMDNSIVVIENIFKKLDDICQKARIQIENIIKAKQNNLQQEGKEQPELSQEEKEEIISRNQKILIRKNQKDFSIEGSREITLAITASTLTTLVVFIPLIFINPEIRILYKGLAMTMCFSLLISLFCAVSLTPTLISRINIKPNRHKFILEPLYKSSMRTLLKFRYILVLLTIVIFILTLFEAFKLEREFMGIAEQNKFTAFIELPTGTRLDITNEVTAKVEEYIREIPEVKTETAKVDPWSSKIYVTLYPLIKRNRSTQEIIDGIRPFAEKLEPAFIYFEEPQEVGTKEILIEIFGYDYEILKTLAMAIGQRMKSIPEFTDTKIRMRKGRPEILVNIDKTQAAMLGLDVKKISLSLHTQIRGLVATRYRGSRAPLIQIEKEATPARSFFRNTSMPDDKEGKELETIVRLDEDFRKTLEQVKRLSFVNPDGKVITLAQIAKFKFDFGPSEIWRKNKSRMVQVSANTGGLALGTAAEKVKVALSTFNMPKNYFWEIGGNYDKMLRNQKELPLALILSLILVYMILASLFESFLQPFIIIISVPLAAIGAVMALRLTNSPISISVFIGAILLGGIVVNNAIILVDRINFLKKETRLDNFNVVVKASTDRLRPILMTSLTTIGAMLFMALYKGESANLWAPSAFTVIGGMSVSTLLTLFVVPSLYLIVEDMKKLFR